jgi:hypothetical protein
MSLAETVVKHSFIGSDGKWFDPNGKVFKDEFSDKTFRGTMATSCHFATVYWLFITEFNREPTEDELAHIGGAEQAVGKMISHGVLKLRPKKGNLKFTVGSVIVFSHNTKMGHSCVAINPEIVGGFNQTGWWKRDGISHSYSSHNTSELQWGDGPNKNHVFNRSNMTWYELFEIPESQARLILHGLAH